LFIVLAPEFVRDGWGASWEERRIFFVSRVSLSGWFHVLPESASIPDRRVREYLGACLSSGMELQNGLRTPHSRVDFDLHPSLPATFFTVISAFDGLGLTHLTCEMTG
jgi:hypothetical protein